MFHIPFATMRSRQYPFGAYYRTTTEESNLATSFYVQCYLIRLGFDSGSSSSYDSQVTSFIYHIHKWIILMFNNISSTSKVQNNSTTRRLVAENNKKIIAIYRKTGFVTRCEFMVVKTSELRSRMHTYKMVENTLQRPPLRNFLTRAILLEYIVL